MKSEKLGTYIRNSLNTKAKKTLPFNIRAVLLFGSAARGGETPDSDVDLLVIADGINTKRHRRGPEIASIKHSFPELSLDILLLTESEVLSNFRNHNPLFLDIAEEGIIILDYGNFLNHLIAETKEYIKRRGIKRFGDGWIFPVEKGTPAYLSRVSNKDFSYAMLKDGERDFEIGRRLADDGYYDKAVYHCQQSVEKSVKSILIAMGIFQKSHLIGGVLRKIIIDKGISKDIVKTLLEVAEISETIEPEVSLSRYPGIIDDTLWVPSEEYNKEDAEKALKKTAKALSIAKMFVEDWFSKTR
jgi:HEPN domain-containing protein/predicted nucleotidyltransferase